MLLSSDCSHCPSVLNHLCELLKSGHISKLEAININQQPEIAQQYAVRSVPWVKISDIELTGQQSKTELLKALERVQSHNGLLHYYETLLNDGQLQQAIDHLRRHPDNFTFITSMMQNEEIQISVQMGIGAIMEEFAGTSALAKLIPELTLLTRHALARIRNDACYYLSLTADPDIIPAITLLLNDTDGAVKETAIDCLQELNELPS